jgi:hypothetical protein
MHSLGGRQHAGGHFIPIAISVFFLAPDPLELPREVVMLRRRSGPVLGIGSHDDQQGREAYCGEKFHHGSFR